MILTQRNNNLSPIPFYEGLEWQDRNKSYAYGHIFPLYAPKENLLPFQILLPHQTGGSDVFEVYLFNKNGVEVGDITQNLIDGGLTCKQFPDLDIDVIVYTGNIPVLTNTSIGQYYITVKYRGKTFYSDIITFVDGIENYLKIEFWDNQNLYFEDGLIVYDDQYKNRVYLCTEVGKPEYTFTEDGNDRDGFYFPEKQLSEKTYRFVCAAPEYICDLLRIVRLSDKIRIYSNGIPYKCDTFLLTVKWLTQGDLAQIECEYQTDTVIKKIAKGGSPEIEITGKIVDWRNKPLLGVRVTLKSGDTTIGYAYTDATGVFVYNWAVYEPQYKLPILAIYEKDGYKTAQQELNINYSKALRIWINFGTFAVDTILYVQSIWNNFINIWQYSDVIISTEWDNFINIWLESCVNAYSIGFSKAYNCNAPSPEIELIPKSVQMDKTGDGIDVQVITSKDWNVE